MAVDITELHACDEDRVPEHDAGLSREPGSFHCDNTIRSAVCADISGHAHMMGGRGPLPCGGSVVQVSGRCIPEFFVRKAAKPFCASPGVNQKFFRTNLSALEWCVAQGARMWFPSVVLRRACMNSLQRGGLRHGVCVIGGDARLAASLAVDRVRNEEAPGPRLALPLAADCRAVRHTNMLRRHTEAHRMMVASVQVAGQPHVHHRQLPGTRVSAGRTL
jgi:hypothetical protein